MRFGLAMIALLAIVQWSRPARADVTITGTVGEIGLVDKRASGNPIGNSFVRFKLTNLAVTQACLQVAGYAWFVYGDAFYREWYAALLVSKKGSTISCALSDNNNQCLVSSCTLP